MRKHLGLLAEVLVILLCAPVLFFTATGAPANAAITYVGDIGSAISKTSGNTLAITTTKSVAAGDDIIIAYATDPNQNLSFTLSDSAGNTYNQAAVSINSGQLRAYIFAAYNVNALPSGSTITIDSGVAVTAKAAVASVFRGLAEIGVLDKTSTGENDASDTASSGATPVTTQADELLIGAVGTEGPQGDSAGTWGNSFTPGPRIGTTGGGDDSNITVSMGYRIVSATGAYTASKTEMTARDHASAIATFKTVNTLSASDYNLLLGRPTNTSVGVNAILEMDGEIAFEYGTVSGSYTSGAVGAASVIAGEPVKAVIGGLAAKTKYYYRLLYRATGSDPWLPGDEFSFHTKRAAGSTFTFTITSDSHLGQTFPSNSPARYEQATLNIAADNPDFHLDLGDAFIMSEASNQAEADDIYMTQRPYFGNFSHSAPIFLVIGNHENEEGWNLDDTPFSQGLGSIIARKKYFSNPIPDGFYTGNTDLLTEIGGDQYREDYYAWTWGDALFIVLDPFQYTMAKPYGTITGAGEGTDDLQRGDQWNWTLGLDQFNWFKQTLQNTNAKYKFVFSHHVVGGQLEVSGAAGTPGYVRGGALAAPYFEWGGLNSDGSEGFTTKRSGWGDDPIHQLMVDNHVSAFFHGHDHQFVHEVRDGIVYQLVPSPGMTGYGFDLYDSSDYVVSGGNLPNAGHVRVTVSPDQTIVEYVRSAIASDAGVTNGRIDHQYTIAPAPVSTCQGDFDGDGDVDGSDLAALIAAPAQLEVSVFATNFGKNNCL